MPSDEYVIECHGRAKLSNAEEVTVKFFILEDEDGDRFVGMELLEWCGGLREERG